MGARVDERRTSIRHERLDRRGKRRQAFELRTPAHIKALQAVGQRFERSEFTERPEVKMGELRERRPVDFRQVRKRLLIPLLIRIAPRRWPDDDLLDEGLLLVI